MDNYYVADTIKELYLDLCDLKEQEIVDNLIDEGYEQAKQA